MIKLNKEQILRQQKQVINNAYTHVSYILKECRPFLLGYIQKEYGLIRTHQRLLFQTLPKLDENGVRLPIDVTIAPTGRWCVFPVGPLDIVDESVILDTDVEEGLSREQLIPIIIQDAIVHEKTLSILSPKVYTLEYNMFKTIEGSLKNTFNNLIKLENT